MDLMNTMRQFGEKRMSDMSSMSRETKKKHLKQRVITNPALYQGKPEPQKEPDSREIIRRTQKKIWKKRLRVIALLLVLIVVAAVGYYMYLRNYQYTDYDVSWEKNFDRGEGSFTGYLNFGNHILRYTKDGASYVDDNGKEVWVQSYEMKSPIAAVNGDYAVVADQQGNSIYIFNKEGHQGTATTLLPILRVTVSGKGVVAAILEDQKANYVSMFRKDGTPLDITIKGLLGGEVGYPLDISLSPDGTQLIGSFVYIENGVMKSKVAFYDFSEVGKNIPTRLVGGFHDIYENGLVARAVFLDSIYSCAFADNSISFFSSENVMSPKLLKQETISEQIRSIFYSPDYVGVIVNTASGQEQCRMDVYRKNGEKLFSESFTYDYLHADIDGDHILLYNEESCRIYNMWGTLKFEGEFDFPVEKIANGKFPGSFIITGPQAMKEIKLK